RRPVRLERVDGTGRPEPGAELRRVALIAGRTAEEARRAERVGWTRVVQPVAALRHIAVAGGGSAHRRALRIGRAAGAGAVLRHVAHTRGGTAGRRRVDEGVGRAVVPDSVAELGDVAQAGAGAA